MNYDSDKVADLIVKIRSTIQNITTLKDDEIMIIVKQLDNVISYYRDEKYETDPMTENELCNKTINNILDILRYKRLEDANNIQHKIDILKDKKNVLMMQC